VQPFTQHASCVELKIDKIKTRGRSAQIKQKIIKELESIAMDLVNLNSGIAASANSCAIIHKLRREAISARPHVAPTCLFMCETSRKKQNAQLALPLCC
jgi:hypothetical protein